MSVEANVIKELAPGVYGATLWCAESSLLRELLDPSGGYVLCWDHRVGNYSWQDFLVPVVSPDEPVTVLSRGMQMDFVVPTATFLSLLPRLRPAIKAVQLGRRPPDHLEMAKLKGKELYRLLSECDWRLLLETPANDYGQVLSPRRDLVERAIAASDQHVP